MYIHVYIYMYIYIYISIYKLIKGKKTKNYLTFWLELSTLAHHFFLLWLNPFDLSDDEEGWWFECSVS